MNIGDKVYCIKDRLYNTITNEVVLEKGKYYTVTNIIKDVISITSDVKEWNSSGNMVIFEYEFKKITKIYKNRIYYNFYEYFLSPTELRKLKLQKIANNVQI